MVVLMGHGDIDGSIDGHGDIDGSMMVMVI